MSYDESDAQWDKFYDQISEELYPEHKEKAIDEFIEERMQSFYLKKPNIINPPLDTYHHANELLQVSSRCALVMYTTSIELFLKSVLLKPVLYGMIHNVNIAEMIVDTSIGRSGFGHYKKLLKNLCKHAANIDLNKINGMDNEPILKEAQDIQRIRNKVLHQGYSASVEEMGKARNIANLTLTEVVEPVLNNMELVIGSNENGHAVLKA